MPNRERLIADIERSGSPMLIARCAIDQVYDDRRVELRQRMRDGESLDSVMTEPFSHDLEGQANILLRDANMYDRSGWADAFALRTTIDAAKAQRIFANAAFMREERVEARLKLKVDAARKYARIACEAMDLLPQVSDPETHGELVGVVSENTVLALLNRGYDDAYAANLSTGLADHKYKIDAKMHSRPTTDAGYEIVNLQIKTSPYWNQRQTMKPITAKMYDEHQIITIVANNFVTSGTDLRRATTLLDRERVGLIDSSELAELNERADNVVDYVFSQVRARSQPAQAQPQAV